MEKAKKILNKNKIEITFEKMIKKAFGVEIFKCQICGAQMEFKDIWYHKCGSLLEKIYERMHNKEYRE